MSREKTKTEIKYLLYGGYFYEWRSSTNTWYCNICKTCFKNKNKISYKPVKYENKIEFLFTDNFKAKDVNEWYEHCTEKGLEDIKLSMPIAVKDPSLLGFSNTSQAGLICYFKRQFSYLFYTEVGS